MAPDLSWLTDALRDIGLDPDPTGDDRVMVTVTGQWRRGLPVLLVVEDRHLRCSAMLAGAIEQNRAEVYGYLLKRNERAGDVRFAMDGEGDVLLVARLPLAVVDAAQLDELLGELLTAADETFNHIVGRGFADYVASEQAWRRSAGVDENPAFPTPPPRPDA
ncbi:MAG: hypothetical protein ACI9AD_001011 [Nitriliruptoraceae bacterium]|jgi:hypothetical protein